jgi:hypothetical protein
MIKFHYTRSQFAVPCKLGSARGKPSTRLRAGLLKGSACPLGTAQGGAASKGVHLIRCANALLPAWVLQEDAIDIFRRNCMI